MIHAVEPILRAMIAYDKGDAMRIHHLLKLCELYQVSSDYILGLSNMPKRSDH